MDNENDFNWADEMEFCFEIRAKEADGIKTAKILTRLLNHEWRDNKELRKRFSDAVNKFLDEEKI